MFSRLRQHVSPATVVAVLALVFAMSGAAYAAKRYLINSTKQISPTVLRALKGNIGKAGPAGTAGPAGPAGPAGSTGAGNAGATGAQGPSGATGKEGPPGSKGEKGEKGEEGNIKKTLPSKATETGTWAARVERLTEQTIPVPISFTIPLSGSGLSATVVHYVTKKEQQEESGPPECKGNVEAPTATAGSFCMYEGESAEPSGATNPIRVAFITPPSSVGLNHGTGTSGAIGWVNYEGSNEESAEIVGSWAVTAP